MVSPNVAYGSWTLIVQNAETSVKLLQLKLSANFNKFLPPDNQ
jgi:hypothetical protein